MSEFLAEAQVLVRPSTAGFRAALLAELKTIEASIPPVTIPVLAAGGAAAKKAATDIATANTQVANSSAAATAALNKQAGETARGGANAANASIATANLAKAEDLNAAATTRLVGAQRAADLTTSKLAGARAILSETSASVAIAERALSVALKTGNKDLIDSVGVTLAKARASEVSARASVQATIAETGQAKAAGALARAESLGAVAVTRLSGAENAAALRTSSLARARAILAETTAATATAERAYAAAVASGDAQIQASTAALLRRAEAEKLAATATVQATIAENQKAAAIARSTATQQFASRGAFTQVLNLLGVRGATLAANSAFLVGAASAVTFFKSLSLAAEVENQLNVFRVTAKATGEELAAVSQRAKELGRDIRLPAVSAGDAIGAMVELAKAGLSVQDSIAGAEGVLQLATAAQIDNAQATEIVANSLNAFGLSGEQAIHVADLLAASSNEAQGSITDVGLALGQVAAVSRQVGVSIEDTVAVLTLLAKNGLQGATAGTALRIAYLRLIAPTKQVTTILDDLNVKLRDAQGNLRPEIFSELQDATAGWSKAQRDAAFATIFGSRAIKVQAILARAGADGLNEMRVATDDFGAVAEISSARTQGLSGKVSQLTNNLESLGLTFGQLASPIAGLGLDILNASFGALATQAEDSKTATEAFFRSFGEDARKVKVFLDEIGAIDFGKDFQEDAEGIAGAIKDASKATDAWVSSLLNLDSASGEAEKGIKGLFVPTADLNQGFKTVTGTLDGMIQKLKDAGATTISPKQILGQVAGFEEQRVKAEIAGDRGEQIGVLKSEEETLRKRLEQDVVKRRPKLRRQLQRELLSVLREIESIEGEIASEEEEHANELEKRRNEVREAREKGFRSVLDSFDFQRSQVQNAILAAAGTASLTDDVKTRETLRSVILKQIAIAKQKIGDRKLLAETLTNLNREFVQNNQDIREAREKSVLSVVGKQVGAAENKVQLAELTESLNDDIKAQINLRNVVRQAIAKLQAEGGRAVDAIQDFQNQRRAIKQRIAELRREQVDERLEGIRLNIEFAQITENRSAEVRGREAEIRAIQDQIAHEKKGTNEYKRLRNELAQKRKELAELKKEKDKTNAFAELTFEFLQTQQGFAANLLGNLIPGFATGGLVGAPAATPTPTPASGLQAQAAFKTAGPTYGQAATEVDVLKQIFQVLKEIQRGRAHPEANYQRATQHSNMDGVGGV